MYWDCVIYRMCIWIGFVRDGCVRKCVACIMVGGSVIVVALPTPPPLGHPTVVLKFQLEKATLGCLHNFEVKNCA